MPPDDLQFDHATYEKEPAGITCGMCGKPVERQYWQWAGRVVCGDCKAKLGAVDAHVSSPNTFFYAAGLATLTALVCGIGYAGFVSATYSQFAPITIGIAYLIAKVIRKATGNVSGRGYQVLAVGLTYFAGVMGYAPAIFGGERPPVLEGVAVMLAAPFLELTHAPPFGILIIGFGLYEAWRRAAPLPMEVTGPYRVPSP